MEAITPALDPEVIQEDVPAAKKGIQAPRQVWEQTLTYKAALEADGGLEPDLRLTKLSEFLEKRQERAERILTESMRAVRRERQDQEARIDESLRPPRDMWLRTELTRRMAGMSREERQSLIQDALEAGPEGGGGEVIGAALVKIPALVGMTKQEQIALRLRWAQRYCPDELVRIKVLERVEGHVERASAAFVDLVGGVHLRAKDAKARADRRKALEQAP